MLTKEQVIQNHSEYEVLINAIICEERLALEDVQDIGEHGADTGIDGFISTNEMNIFFRKYRKNIIQLIKEIANEIGQEPIEMILDFRQVKGSQYTSFQIAELLFTDEIDNEDSRILYMILVYFTVEEICRWFGEED